MSLASVLPLSVIDDALGAELTLGAEVWSVGIEDFRRIALSMEGAVESAHMGNPDFRAGTPKPRIFATLASADQGYGNLKLTPELQAHMIAEWPQWFLPVAGGWGRMGMTHVRLAEVPEDVLREGLRAAWKIAVAPRKSSRKK